MSIPVPVRPCGYRLRSGDAPIQLDVFLDLECPFSKKAWPTMLVLANDENFNRLAITTHLIVLCDHRQSWDLTKAVTAIADDDAHRAWKFISHLYQHQEEYNSAAFDHKTRHDLLKLIQQLGNKFDASLDMDMLSQEIGEDSGALADRTKASVRYAIARGVWSTPTFIINDSPVPELESSSTLQDWQDFLAEL